MRKILSRIGLLLGCVMLALVAAAGTSVATPASDATAGARKGHELSTIQTAPPAKGGASIQVTCNAGVQLDPWALYFDCVLDVPTNVSARCSDGFTFTPRLLPPGSYRILVDCYPAFFSSLIFT